MYFTRQYLSLQQVIILLLSNHVFCCLLVHACFYRSVFLANFYCLCCSKKIIVLGFFFSFLYESIHLTALKSFLLISLFLFVVSLKKTPMFLVFFYAKKHTFPLVCNVSFNTRVSQLFIIHFSV